MIEFNRMYMTNFAGHFVGNKELGEPIQKTDKEYEFKDEATKNIIVDYLVNGFKGDIYYQFKEKDFTTYNVLTYVEGIFAERERFIENSKNIANFLYSHTIHPKIKGGELYVTYFKEVSVDGELCDAIGIFKSETVDTFIKMEIVSSINTNTNETSIIADSGCGIDKLDKGALIFNINKGNGYKIAIINKSKKPEDVTYWEEFLDIKLMKNGYFYTNHALNQAISFCEEVLTEENNIGKIDQMSVLNRSVNFFKSNDVFTEQDFKEQVLNNEEIVVAFDEHKRQYEQLNSVQIDNSFDISKMAVKDKNKFSKGVIKLDKNFQIHINSRHDLLEKGYDDEKGMGFYKIYFIHESI